jgi:hypothetical protein
MNANQKTNTRKGMVEFGVIFQRIHLQPRIGSSGVVSIRYVVNSQHLLPNTCQ